MTRHAPPPRCVAELAADPANGIVKIIDGTDAQRMGGFPDAAFVVFVKAWLHDGAAAFKCGRSTPRWAASRVMAELPDMDGELFHRGQGIPNGRVANRIDMRDIARDVAGLLGVSCRRPKA